jgi:sugar phosphate isomerase/epimerase
MNAKISIGSSAFAIGAYERDPIPFDTVIRRLADLQFDGVELFGARPYGHPDDFPSPERRREFRHKLSDLGLEISNYGADLWSIPLGIGDREARQYEELFKRNLEFCADVSCHSIRVDTVSEPPIPDGVSSEDAWQRIVTTWRNCSRWAEEAGMDVYWEFEPGFIFNKPSEIVRLVDEVAAPNFKVMFDTCHAQMSVVQGARQSKPLETLPSVEHFIRILGKRIGTVHLIDSDNTLHHQKTRVIPARGGRSTRASGQPLGTSSEPRNGSSAICSSVTACANISANRNRRLRTSEENESPYETWNFLRSLQR